MSTKKKAKPAPKTPVVKVETRIATPHPLALNGNELRWFNMIQGPVDGWFSLGAHGNPPFGIPVQLTGIISVYGHPQLTVGTGIRTPEIGPDGKEIWHCNFQCDRDRLGALLTDWRPLMMPPMQRSAKISDSEK